MKKNVFKKNRLVILALSVMIGVAGYLNFNAGKKRRPVTRKSAGDKCRCGSYQL